MAERKEKKKAVYKVRADPFVKIYATNALAEETSADVRLYWFNEVLNTDKERLVVSDGEAILTPEAVVLLHEQLSELLDSWKKKGKTVTVAKERRSILKAIK